MNSWEREFIKEYFKAVFIIFLFCLVFYGCVETSIGIQGFILNNDIPDKMGFFLKGIIKATSALFLILLFY